MGAGRAARRGRGSECLRDGRDDPGPRRLPCAADSGLPLPGPDGDWVRAVVTGGTGFLGRRLCVSLVMAGVGVTVISRDAYDSRKILGPAVSVGTGAGSGAGISVIAWDSPDVWHEAIQSADAVFHLAGASVAGERWTPEYKEKILTSRVTTTRTVVEAGPKVLISASAVGYYGDSGSSAVSESAPPGDDFLATVCVAWESEAERATTNGARVCRMRIGNVLGTEGGALQAMLNPPNIPFSPWKLGLGGPMGSGRQWFPWVHVDDVIALMLFAAFENESARGPINVVAPEPVTNAQFSHALGRILRRPSLVPVPGFVLRAMVGEFAEALLGGQKVVPEAAQRLGYRFRFPELTAALTDLLD
ncbi:MAG: TIGR01777 family protein [Cytophagales bacterium]|nr:TIGR01777 family protein [Armatimonadota bacterium]